MSPWSKYLFLVGALVLLGAALIQLRPVLQVEVHPQTRPLAQLLPEKFAGWHVRDEPVAATAEMARAVDELLHYDEALLRFYETGKDFISVYVAYWKPGRFHPRLVATHTPDICWLETGLKMDHLGTISLPIRDSLFSQAGQYRRFTGRTDMQYVVYWHLVGGRLTGYTDGSLPTGPSFFTHVKHDIKAGQQEQYFIRIATSAPPAQMLQADTPLALIILQLEKLGLGLPAEKRIPGQL